MRILDLFCGAGGAAMGLHQAFPEAEITGVDIEPQPNYPFDFIQGDALEFTANYAGFLPHTFYDFIWASPPCQKYTSAAPLQGRRAHPDLVGPIRDRLQAIGLPYVIENVPGAPLLNPVTLCGLTLGCNVKRHRLFEASFPITPPPCPKGHPGDWLIVFGWSALRRSNGAGTGPKKDRGKTKGKSVPHAEACTAMGIDWMSRTELSQAIPPAYSRFIGEQFKRSRPICVREAWLLHDSMSCVTQNCGECLRESQIEGY
jgi:DNA (cytosine-5)-methyltransferase 1